MPLALLFSGRTNTPPQTAAETRTELSSWSLGIRRLRVPTRLNPGCPRGLWGGASSLPDAGGRRWGALVGPHTGPRARHRGPGGPLWGGGTCGQALTSPWASSKQERPRVLAPTPPRGIAASSGLCTLTVPRGPPSRRAGGSSTGPGCGDVGSG